MSRLAGLLLAATASLSALALPAQAARPLPLAETGHLHRISQHGFTLIERGSATGTLGGTIYVHLTVVSTSRVQAEVSIYSRQGSITGSGTASYRRGEATATFAGSMSIARGSGSYAHAHGSGIAFRGTIKRSDESVSVQVSGRMSECWSCVSL
jgi:hypothetical protein